MTTRFYLPSSGAAAVNPTPASEWDLTASADWLAAVTAPGGTGMAEHGANESVATGNLDVLNRVYVSDTLAAQTISGTVTGQIRVRENNAGLNARAQLIVRVVSGDGLTERGALFSGDATTGNGDPASEFPVGSGPAAATNRVFPRGAAATLASVTCQAGDRLVFEIGYRAHNTSASPWQAFFTYGDNAGSDLPAGDETSTALANPWIELSQTITFGAAAQQYSATLAGSASVASVTRLGAARVRAASLSVTGAGTTITTRRNRLAGLSAASAVAPVLRRAASRLRAASLVTNTPGTSMSARLARAAALAATNTATASLRRAGTRGVVTTTAPAASASRAVGRLALASPLTAAMLARDGAWTLRVVVTAAGSLASALAGSRTLAATLTPLGALAGGVTRGLAALVTAGGALGGERASVVISRVMGASLTSVATLGGAVSRAIGAGAGAGTGALRVQADRALGTTAGATAMLRATSGATATIGALVTASASLGRTVARVARAASAPGARLGRDARRSIGATTGNAARLALAGARALAATTTLAAALGRALASVTSAAVGTLATLAATLAGEARPRVIRLTGSGGQPLALAGSLAQRAALVAGAARARLSGSTRERPAVTGSTPGGIDLTGSEEA